MQSYRKITLNKIILSFNKATRNIAVHGFRLNASYGSSRAEVFCKKGVPRNFTKFAGKHMCQNLFFNKAETCNFIKNETLVQVFSCEFCEISKNTYFIEHLWWLLLQLITFEWIVVIKKGNSWIICPLDFLYFFHGKQKFNRFIILYVFSPRFFCGWSSIRAFNFTHFHSLILLTHSMPISFYAPWKPEVFWCFQGV